MTSPYGPILTGIGLLDSGKLTPAGRQGYVSEVLGLMATGNANGQGGLPSTKIFSSLVPLPPVPGPMIINPLTLESEPLFWFKPDPFAAMMSSVLLDPGASPLWNSIFPDGLYTATAEALDLSGNTALFPIFDVSVIFPDIKVFPISLPDLAMQVNMTPPKLLLKIAGAGIKLSMPTLPSLPSLPIPDFNVSADLALKIPNFPSLALDAAVTLPKFVLGLMGLPLKIIEALLLPPNLGLIIDLAQFKFEAVFNLAFNIVFDLLKTLGLLLVVPKLLIASILIWLKDIVSMLCVDLVGMIVGAGGAITKSIGAITGLIPATSL